ncbi:MAG: hypothetical protein JSU01_11160 [Bacteroidetes bacterium]|nr:hypothetical protein [Bacteroidota bacterium]
MKGYLFTILLFFSGSALYAQSVSFGDLLNLTGMTGVQEHDLLLAKGFKAAGTQTFSGKTFEQFTKVTKGTPDKTESVLLGAGVKTVSGNVTHEIIYNTQQEQDLNNLLAEAKKSNMSLIFQGTDATSNIYRFDNSLFRASISLAFDKKSGNVDVQQK